MLLVASMRLLRQPGKAAIWQSRYRMRTTPEGLCAALMAGAKRQFTLDAVDSRGNKTAAGSVSS